MATNAKKCREKLLLINRIKNKRLRDKMISLLMDDCMHKGIQEIILKSSENFENLPMSHRRKLARNERKLKAFLHSRYSAVNKRKIAKQVGGFWQALIPLGVSLVSSLIN